MALNLKVGTLVQPGSTGNQTLSLGTGFNPKAIILWSVGAPSDSVASHEILGVGFAADSGGGGETMTCVAMSAEDGAGTQDAYTIANNGSRTLQLHNGTTGAVDMELLVDTFNSDSVVINWANLFTTASARVHYLVLGGAEVTDAYAGSFTADTGSATQDVTVDTGFGKPELVFFACVDQASTTGQSQGSISFGFAKQGEAGRAVCHTAQDANTIALCSQSIYNNKCLVAIDQDGSTVDARGGLDSTVASWPTDGFRIAWESTPSFAAMFHYLAIRTTASITSGEGSALTSGSTQNLDHGSAPRGALLLNARTATANTVDSTSADCSMIGIGAGDGTDECWAGISNDDGAATMAAKRFSTASKSIAYWNTATTKTSEADGSISSNNFVLTWNDLDATAFKYEWLTLGDTASGPEEITGAATLTGTGSLAAAGRQDATGASALSGTGSLAAAGRQDAFGAATLTGEGSLSASGELDPPPTVVTGAATLTGTGSLTASGQRDARTGSTLAGTGSLTANGYQDATGAAALTGTGVLTASGVIPGDALVPINPGTLTLTPEDAAAATLAAVSDAALTLTAKNAAAHSAAAVNAGSLTLTPLT